MTARVPSQRRRSVACGFTLIEVALTLLIVTILLGALMIPLQTQVEARKVDETREVLERAREALLGYAAAYGYLPCPATDTSMGREPGDADHDTGACPSGYHGFLPAALLGLDPVDQQGYATDAWGGAALHRIRYAVSNESVGGITNPFTRSGGMANAGVATVGANSNLLYICDSGSGVDAATDCGTAMTLASNVVAVVWSLGQNAGSGGSSVHEAENPNPNSTTPPDRIFVSRVRVTSGPDEFDDQLAWIPTFVIVTRLIASGQLP